MLPGDHLTYRRRPSAWSYMLGAVQSAARRPPGEPLPQLSAAWRGCRPSDRAAAHFARLGGLHDPADRLPALFLHAIAFRLQMVVLTRPSLPVPIWRMLQVRNRMHELAPVPRDAVLDLECRTHALRVLPKGLEVDLRTTVYQGGTPVAESLNTFYARGAFGTAATDGSPAPAPAPASSQRVASWHLPGGGGLRFGALTGDYNGVHLSDAYARAMGFRRAFFHPLRVVSQCLAHAGLAEEPPPRRLDVWLKGPVFHDSDLQLLRGEQEGVTVLTLMAGVDPRPAVVLQLRGGADDAVAT